MNFDSHKKYVVGKGAFGMYHTCETVNLIPFTDGFIAVVVTYICNKMVTSGILIILNT